MQRMIQTLPSPLSQLAEGEGSREGRGQHLYTLVD
jgi:hypothetical protein